MQRGEPVAVRAGFIGIGSGPARVVVDCRSASRWQPAPARAIAPGLERRLTLVASGQRQSLLARHGRDGAARGRHTARRTARPAAIARTSRRPRTRASRRPATTCWWACSPRSGSRHRRRPRRMRPSSPARSNRSWPTTTDLSAHLLRQAARGLFGRALHELVSALADDTAPDALRESIARVLAIGATSGADACAGVARGRAAFLSSHRRKGRSMSVRSRYYPNLYKDSVSLMTVSAKVTAVAGDRARPRSSWRRRPTSTT